MTGNIYRDGVCRDALAICITLSSLLVGASAAMAQTDPNAEQDIIVTAQRRAERLEDVPMAVTALTPSILEKSGVTGMTDLGRVAAGVQINFGGNSTQPAIRGVSTLTTGNGVENNVAIYVDGFYETSNTAINSELINIAGIEVLKGPQGTLYGRNATGGAILINTLAPSDVWTGKVQGKYGNLNDRSLSGYLSGPISDRIRFSVGGFYRKSDGWIKLISPTTVGQFAGDAAPIEQGGVRAKLEIELSDAVKATLGYNYGYTSDPHTVLFSAFAHLSPALPAPPGRITEVGTAASNYQSRQVTKSHQGTLKLEADTGIGKLTSYTGYSHSKDNGLLDADGSYADLSSLALQYDLDSFQQAIDLSIDTIDRFKIVLGGLYYHDKFDGDNAVGTTINGANGALLLVSRPVIRTDAWAAYIDASYELTDHLTIDAGGRYSRDRKTFTFSTQLASGTYSLAPTTREASFGKFTPRVSLRYEIAPRTNIYASWSRGFRSGSFNPSGASTADLLLPIRPETITAYEVGLKLARPHFRFDVAGFYYDYKDINVSVSVPNPTCPSGSTCPVVNLFGNAPGATVYGIDGQFSWQPVEELTLRAGAAWLHARYDTFTNATGTGLNTTTDRNVTSQVQDWTGQQMARAPNFTANAGVDYTVDLADGDLSLSANGAYSDSYVVNNASVFGALAGNLAGQQRYRQKATFLLDAQISWTDPTDHYSIGVFGKNLTDVRYFDTYTGNSFGDYGSLARPRTYGVRVGYQF